MEEFLIFCIASGAGLAILVAIILPICSFVALRSLKERQDEMASDLHLILNAMRAKDAETAKKEEKTSEKLHDSTAKAQEAQKGSEILTEIQKSAPKGSPENLPPPIPHHPTANEKIFVKDAPSDTTKASTYQEVPKEAKSAFQPHFTDAGKSPDKETEFERGAREIISKLWNWIIVGEEHRPKNFSLEYAVASVWLLRVSILIIVTGIGFFLQYSIEKNLIGPYGRVAASIACGLAMLVFGTMMAGKKYHLIAQGLLGGGIATLYLSIFASYRIYKLIPEMNIAFVLMLLITVSAAVISLRLNSMLTAIFGLVGAYCTPIMLSTGTADLPGLFAYILLIGVGVIWIAAHKEWKILNALSFFFTYALYCTASNKHYEAGDFTISIVFLSLFFLLFASIPVMNNMIHRMKSNALTLCGMFFNAAIFFTLSAHLIGKDHDREWIAASSLSLAFFYTVSTVFFLRRKLLDKNLLVLMIGFASFFIAISVPLLLSDEWITASWSAQALVFLWMSRKIGGNFLRGIAYILYFIAFAHLAAFDFSGNFRSSPESSYLDEMLSRLISFGSLIISMALGWRLLRSEPDKEQVIAPENDTGDFLPSNLASSVFAAIGFLLLFVYLHFEFSDISREFYPPCRVPLISMVWVLALIASALFYAKTASPFILKVAIFLCFGIVLKIIFFDFAFWEMSYDTCRFSDESLLVATSMRLLNFLMLSGALACSFVLVGKRNRDSARFFAIICLALLFSYSTLELNTFLNIKAPQFRAAGISILWGVFALSFILAGIMKHVKSLRYAGLILFTIIVVKVFFSDLGRLPQISRIIAFIVLGLLVLAASFLYIRFSESFNTDRKDEDKK